LKNNNLEGQDRDLNGEVYRTKSGLSPVIAISITKLRGSTN